jgi:hypothetical protein
VGSYQRSNAIRFKIERDHTKQVNVILTQHENPTYHVSFCEAAY